MSCNGLLLCEFYPSRGLFFWPKEFIICNPTTQFFSSIVVPLSLRRNYPHAYVSLSFDPNQNQYQLLLFECYRDHGSERVVCKTYMPEECEWKEREKSLLMGYSWMILCPYFKGSYSYMLSYNFEDGKTTRVLFPEEVRRSLTELCYHDVCILKEDSGIYLVIWDQDSLVFNFWFLEDYQSSSWSMFLTTLSFEEMGLEEDSIVLGFTLINENSLVFATKSEVYRYDLVGEEGKKAEKICDHKFECELNFFSYSILFNILVEMMLNT